MEIKDKIDEIIKQYIIGYCCKECGGGGANGQEECTNCKGLGIVDWETKYSTEKILQSFANLVREKKPVKVSKKLLTETHKDCAQAYELGRNDGYDFYESNLLSSLGMEEKV